MQPRVEPLAHELHGLQQMSQTLEGVELALQRHQNAVRGDEGVDRQQAERRRAVDDDPAVEIDALQCVLEPALTVLDPDELDLGAHEVDVGGQDTKRGRPCGAKRFVERLRAEEDVIHRRIETSLLDAEARRGVALRVEVHEQGRALGECEACCEVDGGRGLAHAALLVHDRDGFTHGSSVPRPTLYQSCVGSQRSAPGSDDSIAVFHAPQVLD